MGTEFRLTKKEIDAKIKTLEARAKKYPKDADDINAEIAELKAVLKDGKYIKENNITRALDILEGIINENVAVAELLGTKFKAFQDSVVDKLKVGFPASIPMEMLKQRLKLAQDKGETMLAKQIQYIISNGKDVKNIKESVIEKLF